MYSPCLHTTLKLSPLFSWRATTFNPYDCCYTDARRYHSLHCHHHCYFQPGTCSKLQNQRSWLSIPPVVACAVRSLSLLLLALAPENTLDITTDVLGLILTPVVSTCATQELVLLFLTLRSNTWDSSVMKLSLWNPPSLLFVRNEIPNVPFSGGRLRFLPSSFILPPSFVKDGEKRQTNPSSGWDDKKLCRQ